MPFQPGNKLATGGRKEKPFRDALRAEIAAAEAANDDPRALRKIARKLLGSAAEGDIQAIKEVADRLDGKVPQAIGGDDEMDAIRLLVTGVERAGENRD